MAFDTLASIGFVADTRQLKEAGRDLDSLATKGQSAERKITGATDGMTSGFNSSKAAVGALSVALGGLASVASIAQVVKYSDSWSSYNNVLRQVSKTEEDFAKSQKDVLALAKATNSNLQSTAELYGELTRATSDLGLSSDRVLGVVGTINKLFLAGGKSAAEASGSIRQLSQALGAGALRGDEFNSVAEGAPRILDALAKQLNMTRGELREFAAEGGITAEIMVGALENYSAEADKMVAVTKRTFAQTSEVVQANITQWVGTSKTLESVTDSVSGFMLSASENIEGLSRAAMAASAVLGGAWLISLGRATAASIALGAAQSGLTLTTYALTAATRVLLGPIGLIATAIGVGAAAFYATAESQQEVSYTSKQLASDIDSLTGSIDEMTRAQKDSLSLKIKDRLVVLEAEAKALKETVELKRAVAGFDNQELKEFGSLIGVAGINSEALTAAATHAEAKLNGMEAETSKLNGTLSQLEVMGDSSAKALIGVADSAKEVAKQMASLDDKISDHYEGLEILAEIEDYRAEQAYKNAEDEHDRIERAIEDIDRQGDKVKEFQSISEKAAERIESAFADAWMNAFDGFESVVDGMKNAFKRMLAEMAHMALTRPIMVSMGMGGMLPGAANAATGGISSGLGLLGGVGSSLIGAGGMLGGAFGGGLAGAGGLISAGNIGGLFSGAGSLLGSGNIAAGLGMSMPIIAGAVVAAMGINKLTGGGLFGTSFKTDSQSLGLSLGGGDISGGITTEESRKKSLFRGTKRRTTTTGFDTTEIDAAFDQITAALGQAATTFGITGADEIINGFAASVNINIKDKSEAEIQQAIADWVSGTTGALVNAVFGNSLD